MSTVIHRAYRTRPGVNLFELVRTLRPRAEAEATKVLRAYYEELLPRVRPATVGYAHALEAYKDDRMARILVVHELLRRGYRMQLGQPYRGPFHLDVSICIRELGGVFYLRPHCDWTMRDALDFLATDTRLEDFSYWDDTDSRPAGVTEAAWEHRRETWEKLTGAPEEGWRDSLILEVCSWDALQFVDPYLAMMDEAHAAREARAAVTVR